MRFEGQIRADMSGAGKGWYFCAASGMPLRLELVATGCFAFIVIFSGFHRPATGMAVIGSAVP
jgi:hypothetical protein